MKKVLLLTLSLAIIAEAQDITIGSDTNITKVLNQVLSDLKKDKNQHPLREFVFLYDISDETKAIYYVIKDDKEAIKIILETPNIDPLKVVNVPFGLENLNGKYSMLSSAIMLKRFDIVKLITDSLDDATLKSKYLEKMMYESIDEDLTIYHYLLSKGISPTYQTTYLENNLTKLALYGTLKDIKDTLQKGAKIDTSNPLYLQYALQRDSFEIARFFIENYDLDLGATPHDNRYFPSYLLYLTKLDSSKSENLEFFRYFIKKMPKEEIKKYKDEFLKRVKEENPSFFDNAKSIINGGVGD